MDECLSWFYQRVHQYTGTRLSDFVRMMLWNSECYLFMSVTESYFNILCTLLLCTIVIVWKTTSSKLDSMIHKTVKEKKRK